MSIEYWIGFNVFVLIMLALDLGVFHRKAHEVGFREAAVWSGVWVGLALVFNVGVYFFMGADKAAEFLSGYLVEKSLSVDNIFLFIVTFTTFAVPKIYQHRILFWGIIGALITRGAFIFVGAELLKTFHWLIYVFGAILIGVGVKLFFQKEEKKDLFKNPIYRFLRRIIPATPDLRGGAFFVKEGSRRLATPLFFALVTIELTDILFAVESIPAIFAITDDPFIVYTSNIFAILGLRSLYFLISGSIHKFAYLTKGVSLVLCFIGVKMLMSEFYKVPTPVSLAVIVGVLATSIVYSWMKRRNGTG